MLTGGELVLKRGKAIVRLRFSDGREVEVSTGRGWHRLLAQVTVTPEEIAAEADRLHKGKLARLTALKDLPPVEREKRRSVLDTTEARNSRDATAEQVLRNRKAMAQHEQQLREAVQLLETAFGKVEEILL